MGFPDEGESPTTPKGLPWNKSCWTRRRGIEQKFGDGTAKKLRKSDPIKWEIYPPIPSVHIIIKFCYFVFAKVNCIHFIIPCGVERVPLLQPARIAPIFFFSFLMTSTSFMLAKRAALLAFSLSSTKVRNFSANSSREEILDLAPESSEESLDLASFSDFKLLSEICGSKWG